MKKLSKLLVVLILLTFAASALLACKPEEQACEHNYINGVCTLCKDKDANFVPCGANGHTYADNVCSNCGFVDYVAKLTFDMNSDTKKLEVPLPVRQYIDGDTTHFDVPATYEYQFADGVFKARYLAVNTPESTSTIQDYGGKASRYVHDTLENAVSVYVEADGDIWDEDSTKSRVMAWIWYKTSAAAEYRNLNLELLQLGLGAGSSAAKNRYGTFCSAALSQAIAFKLDVHSGIPDPEIYRGDLLDVTVSDLRLNQDFYNGKKVAVRGVVTVVDGTSAYIESVDETSGIAYGIQIFMGYNPPSKVREALTAGNYILVTGTFKLSDYGFPPQITSLIYNVRKPDDPDNTRTIETAAETKVKASYKELTIDEFFGNSTVTYTVPAESEDAEITTVTKTVATAELMRDATVSMKNIEVTSVYTTKSGNNEGAISITGQVNGREITIRTSVMYENGAVVTEDVFKGKTIDVTGIVDFYSDRDVYQIKIFSLANVTFR